jgi:hypothetical protein
LAQVTPCEGTFIINNDCGSKKHRDDDWSLEFHPFSTQGIQCIHVCQNIIIGIMSTQETACSRTF